MVYFVCESCNETLKKAQVDRHLYSCKRCWGVTCVDCNFTFEGDSFRAHTSCVSEDQKYQGALFKAPKAKQKNRGVNEIWTDTVLRAATNGSKGTAPNALGAHLVRMGDLGNVPRQEKKFKNFIKNSMRVFDDGVVAKLWDYLDGVRNDINREEKEAAAATASAQEKPAEKSTETSAETSPTEPTKKEKRGKKRARAAEGLEEGNGAANNSVSTNGSSPVDSSSSGGTGSGDSGDGDSSSSSSSRRRRQRVEKEGEAGSNGAAASVAEAGGEPGIGGEGLAAADLGDNDDVDAATHKALVKAAIGIIKKAPNKKMAVKELTKQAAAASQGANSSKQLRRALRQRLKKGEVRRVTVENDVATYSKD